MKKFALFTATLITMIFFAFCAFAAETDPADTTPLQGFDRVEKIVYGAPQTGGLLIRLSKIERDLFGMELPGSLTERQLALEKFVETGNDTQPSLLFKIGVAEWVTLRRTYPSSPLTVRVPTLERTLENETREGALSVRLERILSKLLPSGVGSMNMTVPTSTVFKARFARTLTVRNVKKDDIVELELNEDCIINGILAAPKGNRIFAQVTKVKMPRSFGRPSEIGVEFQSVETLDGQMTAVYIGEAAKEAMKLDAGAMGAAGASIMGAALVGPAGLLGGFLVRGSDKQIPEGTLVYVESTEATNAMGFLIPTSMGIVVDPETP